MPAFKTVAVGTATAILTGGALLMAPPAGAATPAAAPSTASVHVHPMNFTSYLSGVRRGYESRRWHDESYTQVLFTGCSSELDSSVTLTLYRDVFGTDPSYGSIKLTNCFKGAGHTSNAQWYHLPSGDYYFKIADIDGPSASISDSLYVDKVYQDTTLAD